MRPYRGDVNALAVDRPAASTAEDGNGRADEFETRTIGPAEGARASCAFSRPMRRREFSCFPTGLAGSRRGLTRRANRLRATGISKESVEAVLAEWWQELLGVERVQFGRRFLRAGRSVADRRAALQQDQENLRRQFRTVDPVRGPHGADAGRFDSRGANQVPGRTGAGPVAGRHPTQGGAVAPVRDFRLGRQRDQVSQHGQVSGRRATALRTACRAASTATSRFTPASKTWRSTTSRPC